MRKIILLVFVFFVAFPFSGSAASRICAKRYDVEIERVYPPFRILGHDEKRSTVEVVLPVDCQTRLPSRPINYENAIEILDKSLPLDFKVALIQGDNINIYYYGSYGASVVEDLDAFFSKKWGLDEKSILCTKVEESVDSHSCFFLVLSGLRDSYKSSKENQGSE